MKVFKFIMLHQKWNKNLERVQFKVDLQRLCFLQTNPMLSSNVSILNLLLFNSSPYLLTYYAEERVSGFI